LSRWKVFCILSEINDDDDGDDDDDDELNTALWKSYEDGSSYKFRFGAGNNKCVELFLVTVAEAVLLEGQGQGRASLDFVIFHFI